jgi:hypothetical protein
MDIEAQHQQEPDDQETLWTSCCVKLDKRATIFFSTLTISLIMIAFCIVKLSLTSTCEETNTWVSLLTFILGIWIRTPSF